MSDFQGQTKTSVTEDVAHKSGLLENLPFDILEQIINDLPFNTILELVRTRSGPLIECIGRSSTYKVALSDIDTDEELAEVANILGFFYNVSAYRYRAEQLCRWCHRAASRWRRKNNGCGHREKWRICIRSNQYPYSDYSIRGARWNREKLLIDINASMIQVIVKNPIEIYPSELIAQPVESNTTKDATSTRVQVIHVDQLLKQVKQRLQIDDGLDLVFHGSSLTMLGDIEKKLLVPKQSEKSIISAAMCEGVDHITAGPQKPPIHAINRLAALLRDLLSRHEHIRLCGTTLTGNGFHYIVPISWIEDILLREFFDLIVYSKGSNFAILQMEQRIHESLRKVPISSYWYFYDYFSNCEISPPRFNNIAFPEQDWKLFEDAQFWWDSVQGMFRSLKSKRLMEVANILDRFPFMLVKRNDWSPRARQNSTHVRNNIVSRAKMMARYNPFARRLKTFRSLTECPGLPLIPEPQLLEFFFDILTRYCVNLDGIIDLQKREAFLSTCARIESQFLVPKLIVQRVSEKFVSGEDRVEPSTALGESPRPEGKFHTTHETHPSGYNYDEQMLQHILTALCGLPNIYRITSPEIPCERVLGNYKDQNLTFVRCHPHSYAARIPGPRPEVYEPFDERDLQWLIAFLTCCEFFKDNFVPQDQFLSRWKDYFAAGPIEATEEQKQTRSERRLQKQQKRFERKLKKQQEHKEAEERYLRGGW